MTLKSSVRILAVVVLLCIAAPLSRNQEYDKRDGNWWREIDPVAKANYLAGFLDGMELGGRFAYWGVENKKEASAALANSYSENRAKYLGHVSGIRLTDEMDAFYVDPQNSGIPVYGAVWLVLNQIAGKSKADMQPLIEAWRKNPNQQ